MDAPSCTRVSKSVQRRRSIMSSNVVQIVLEFECGNSGFDVAGMLGEWFFVGEMTVMLLTTEKESRWRLPSRQMQTGHWSVMYSVGHSSKPSVGVMKAQDTGGRRRADRTDSLK